MNTPDSTLLSTCFEILGDRTIVPSPKGIWSDRNNKPEPPTTIIDVLAHKDPLARGRTSLTRHRSANIPELQAVHQRLGLSHTEGALESREGSNLDRAPFLGDGPHTDYARCAYKQTSAVLSTHNT